MKLLIDVDALETDGKISADQAAMLRRQAMADTGAFAINVLLSLGVVAIVAGIFALEPSVWLALGLGLVLAAGGIAIERFGGRTWSLMSVAFMLTGAVTVALGVLAEWEGTPLAFGIVTAVFALTGALGRNRLLLAASTIGIAGLFGSAASDWRDEVSTVMREPVIMIGLFGALTVVAIALARALPEAGKRLAQAFGWASLIWVNVAMWAGSLWGDYPGESFLSKAAFTASTDVPYFSRALAAWRETAFHIPDYAFALVWTMALIGAGIWAGVRGRRGVVNGVAVLGTIHLFSQWFEHLKTSPETVIAAGIVAVIIAVLLWAYNKSEVDAKAIDPSSGAGEAV